MAQSLGIPSSFINKTSVGISRIVEVIGATVTSPKKSSAESRVRITTGRFLSGFENLYQRTSPLFMALPKPVLSPNHQTLRALRVYVCSPQSASVPVHSPEPFQGLIEEPGGENPNGGC